VIATAEHVTRHIPPGDHAAEADALWRWFTTRYRHDQNPAVIVLYDPADLEGRAGRRADCKTLSAYLAALLASIGWEVALVYGRRTNAWHVWVIARSPAGEVVTADPTYPNHGLGWNGNAKVAEELWMVPIVWRAGDLQGIGGKGKLDHPAARPPTQDEWNNELWKKPESTRTHRNVAWGGLVLSARPWESDQLYLIRTPADAQDVWPDHPHYQASAALIASTPGAFAIVMPIDDGGDQWIFFKKGEGSWLRKQWELHDRNVQEGVYPQPLAWTPTRCRVWIPSERAASEDPVSRHDSAKKCFHGRGNIDEKYRLAKNFARWQGWDEIEKSGMWFRGITPDDFWRPGWETAMRADEIPSRYRGQPIGKLPGIAARKSNICAGHWRGGQPGFDLGSALADFFVGASQFIPVVGPILSTGGSIAKAVVEGEIANNNLMRKVALRPSEVKADESVAQVAIAQQAALNVLASNPAPPPIVLGSVPIEQTPGIVPPQTTPPLATSPATQPTTQPTQTTVPAQSGGPANPPVGATTPAGSPLPILAGLGAIAAALFTR
jgi:hypothetical protein